MEYYAGTRQEDSSKLIDDAGGHERGLRAESSPALFHELRRGYGIAPSDAPYDLGGSSNLNLLIVTDGQRRVARVYRPSVSPERLGDIQRARRRLAESGFPCPIPIAATDGRSWAQLDGRLVEVEEFVDHDGYMATWERVEEGLRILGQMHEVLRLIDATAAGRKPRFVNYLEPRDVVAATARGVERIRGWSPTADEASLAGAAEELAELVSNAQTSIGHERLPRQLVHGDFWHNNVLYRGEEIVLIHDFDHMGERARIEDLALTLYFMTSEQAAYFMTSEQAAHSHPAHRRLRLRRLVDAYDSGLETALTAAERAAIPVALARQPLWSVGGWIADLDDERAARRHANGMNEALEFALEIMRDLPAWQQAFA